MLARPKVSSTVLVGGNPNPKQNSYYGPNYSSDLCVFVPCGRSILDVVVLVYREDDDGGACDACCGWKAKALQSSSPETVDNEKKN